MRSEGFKLVFSHKNQIVYGDIFQSKTPSSVELFYSLIDGLLLGLNVRSKEKNRSLPACP